MSSNNKEGRPCVYENSFKIMVAREYLSSKLGYGKLAKKHNLPTDDTVRYFVRWYKANYPLGQEADLCAATAQKSAISSEVEELRKQLQQSNLKVAAWELLLEKARKELEIDIIKKYGTKQSGK